MKKDFSITSAFTVKSFEEEKDVITIEGYANTTSKDRVGDIIEEGAWLKGGLNSYLKNPILLAYHDHSRPIGTVVDYSVDSKGLRIVGEVSKAAGEVYQFIKDGVLKTFSVGFRVKDADYDDETDTFFIKDLDLHEVSVVSVPANADSIFSVRKSFESDDEYDQFKGEFVKMTDQTKETPVEEVVSTPSIEDVTKKLEADIAAKFEKQGEQFDALLDIMVDLQKSKQEEKDNMSESEKTVSVEAPNVESLIAEVEKRIAEQFEAKEKSLTETLDGLQSQLAEKGAEIEALTKNKMSFEDRSRPAVSSEEIEKAIMVAKILGRPLNETKAGRDLIEKSGQEHLANMGTPGDWEKEFSTNITNEMQDKLIMEPLFQVIPMNVPTLELPINPEAGYAQWITSASFRSTNGASTGTAVDHDVLYNRTLTAHKLATKEYLGYEEEEDSILPIAGLVRNAVVRRMARASDQALLIGDIGVNAGAGAGAQGTYPFNGAAVIATDAGNVGATPSIGGSEKVTVAHCQAARRQMGKWGLDPSQVRYIVSTDAYYDLLDDPDFRTVDVVGSNATILRGQIGSINGSPVMVSDSFAAKASGATAVLAINTDNYIVGNLRTMMVERDRNVEDQKNVLVASRRFGFLQLTTGDGEGVGVVNWAA